MNHLIQHYTDKFAGEHTEYYQNLIPDSRAAAWLDENIPHFSCDDSEIERIYYFRYWTYRKHIKYTPDGYVITEFLPKVGWSGEYNMIACPVGHHINEGRWLADTAIIKDDIRKFLSEGMTRTAVKYSSSFLWSIYEFCRMRGEYDFALSVLPDMERLYGVYESEQFTKYGLFWSNDNRDGMEYSVSGSGLRPTINSYMYGALLALSDLCRLAARNADSDVSAAYLGKADVYTKKADAYARKADALRDSINRYLWDAEAGFYKTVPMDTVDADPDFSRVNPDRDCREEIGYIPFAYPELADSDKAAAFALLLDSTVFAAPYGITTADMSHPLFMKNPIRHECLWDGPVWPYATSQTLTSLYTYLRRDGTASVSGKDFMKLLSVYAASHSLYENGRKIDWIDENIEPFTGQWISRDLIRLDHIYAGKFPPERGAEYNHSTFCDLVLSGACGIHFDFTPDGNGRLTVEPLAKDVWKRFTVTNLMVRGRNYGVYFDNGRLKVLCDNTVIADAVDRVECEL